MSLDVRNPGNSSWPSKKDEDAEADDVDVAPGVPVAPVFGPPGWNKLACRASNRR